MPREAAFKSGRMAFAVYGGFFKDVAEEIGIERALALHVKQGDRFGAMLAGTMKERLSRKPLDTRTLASVLSEADAAFGLSFEIEQDPTSVTVRGHACPIYDGLKAAGVDHQTIELMCRGISAAEVAELKKSYPQLSASLRFRSTPEGSCVEEWALVK